VKRPNILLILNDDMGFSDIGCYGGEVQTPNLDDLADGGLRYTGVYNTARCCPSRASMLSGLHPHQANVGHMTSDDGIDGYRGDLSSNCVTIAEVLRDAGYATYMSGKWHVTRYMNGPKDSWPCQRGFEEFYGTIQGAANYFAPITLTRNNDSLETPRGDYYYTDAISDKAVEFLQTHSQEKSDQPFFAYVAYTAPHWPLHAPPEDIERYKGRFDEGWDALREQRLERMVEMGLIRPEWKLTPRDPSQPEWTDAENKEWQLRRMEVYAAQIDRMDQGIGRILDALRETGELDNTLVVFLADNGGCAEELPYPDTWISRAGLLARLDTCDGRPIRVGNDPESMPGDEETYQSYGVPWANLSNTPFRLYKHWVHEGGISTPFIVHWPAGIAARGELRHQLGQLPDIMATFLDVADAPYPQEFNGHTIPPAEGFSLAPTFDDGPAIRDVLYWEHEGNKAVRRGKWKLVCKYPGPWELYDMDADRSELSDLSAAFPEIVKELAGLHDAWAARCKVMPWAELQELRASK